MIANFNQYSASEELASASLPDARLSSRLKEIAKTLDRGLSFKASRRRAEKVVQCLILGFAQGGRTEAVAKGRAPS